MSCRWSTGSDPFDCSLGFNFSGRPREASEVAHTKRFMNLSCVLLVWLTQLVVEASDIMTPTKTEDIRDSQLEAIVDQRQSRKNRQLLRRSQRLRIQQAHPVLVSNSLLTETHEEPNEGQNSRNTNAVHKRRTQTNKKFPCSACGKEFRTESILKMHE
ncbi:unnamed protein product, partial [Cyprideis torosa]